MKIAIISDIHDNLVNLRKCLVWCRQNNIEKLICCGDVTNGETLGILSQEFSGEIFLVRGNMEIYEEDELEPFKNYTYGGPPSPNGFGEASRTAIFDIGGKKIGVCHEPFLIAEILNNNEFPSPPAPRSSALPSEVGGGVAATAGVGFPKKIDYIFYGHTHKPWIEERDGVKIVNPGTLGGVFSRATFAVWDLEKGEPELKILELL